MAKIADEEVAHVAVGVFWFVSVCQKMGRTPDSTFTGFVLPLNFLYTICNMELLKHSFSSYLSHLADILDEYNVELKGPFNYSAREEAGIPRDW